MPDTTSQKVALTELKSVEIKADFFTTDNLGNCYVVQKDQVTKFSSMGDSVGMQSFKWLGSITSIDAANSLRIILFYRDLNQFVVLDNTLSMQGEPVKLEKAGFEFSTLMCQSPNNQNFWLYETQEFRLLRLDRNFKIINNSGNLTQVLAEEINPNYIQEDGNHLYLNNPSTGLIVFDMFGTYYKTIPIKGLDYFQVINGELFYLQKGILYKYNQLDHLSTKIELPVEELLQFRIEKERLFLLTKDKMFFFAIP